LKHKCDICHKEITPNELIYTGIKPSADTGFDQFEICELCYFKATKDFYDKHDTDKEFTEKEIRQGFIGIKCGDCKIKYTCNVSKMPKTVRCTQTMISSKKFNKIIYNKVTI